MMETLVGTDGSSGGDAPPKMAKNLKFEPGTLSIFQVSLSIESCVVTRQTTYFGYVGYINEDNF